MDNTVKVYVTPANNNSQFLESISTQSTGHEDISDGALVNKELSEVSKTSAQLAALETDDEEDDEVFTKTEDFGKENIPSEMERDKKIAVCSGTSCSYATTGEFVAKQDSRE